ncbi:T-cell surface glycoprotein CD8 alpha chain [Anguilla rostrata]|uniref:T-cell surface glycoprotein CD8 alpha chain n=1 Tax=Anguilla rostrata TaxID=7938 RepID=UPI0030D0B579
MSQMFERIFVILVIFQYTHQQPSADFYEEKATVSLKCEPPSKGNIINWIRIREDKIEFIASFTTTGEAKTNLYANLFGAEKINQNILILKEFQKARDSGIYSCASFNKNALHFGKSTRIQGKQEARPTIKTTAAATAALPRPRDTTCSSVPCTCQTPAVIKVLHPNIKCELMIFAPLVGGCGVLILILIITICYCNRTRTKRCPHHYKRTPRNPTPVRQATPDRYV